MPKNHGRHTPKTEKSHPSHASDLRSSILLAECSPFSLHRFFPTLVVILGIKGAIEKHRRAIEVDIHASLRHLSSVSIEASCKHHTRHIPDSRILPAIVITPPAPRPLRPSVHVRDTTTSWTIYVFVLSPHASAIGEYQDVAMFVVVIPPLDLQPRSVEPDRLSWLPHI